MKHTPGPWTAHDDDGTGTLPCVLSAELTAYGNFYVAQCHVYDDARLIALAPDLAAMLRRFVDGINDEWHPVFHSGGLLSEDERNLLDYAEALLKRLDES